MEGAIKAGKEVEECGDGVYLLSRHTRSAQSGHSFTFELLVTETPKTTAPRRVDFQISFAGSRNMACHGESVLEGGEVCRLEVAGDGEIVALCECRTVDPAQKAHLTFETAMAEQLMVPDDSDDDDDE